MNHSAILQGKRALIFGAGGSIGAAAAAEFAAEGAEVFLSGRHSARLDIVGERIAAAGGRVHAIETLLENLAFELGPDGIRVVGLRTTANTDSAAIRGTAQVMGMPEEEMFAVLAGLNFLKTPARVADTAKAAALIASDRFRLLTGTVVNSSAGAALD
ncbi:MAG: SDR family oxidoreductase [Acidobacteriota bacterium]|nr:SDR family oxidoreductase [Acidobacteriota bacterium]